MVHSRIYEVDNDKSITAEHRYDSSPCIRGRSVEAIPAEAVGGLIPVHTGQILNLSYTILRKLTIVGHIL